MEIIEIKSENEYRQALKQYDEMAAEVATPSKTAALERLAALIDKYEVKHPSHDIWFKKPNRE